MKKTLLSLTLSLLTLFSYAYDVEIDGIFYNLNKSSKTAAVAGSNLAIVNVPDKISYSGISFVVNEIAESAFDTNDWWNGNQTLKEIYLPNTIKTIGHNAFLRCYLLEYIEIPNSVTDISDAAFQWCNKLKKIKLSDSLTEIKSYTFSRCQSLQSVIIPSKVTKIGYNAFYDCRELKELELSSSLKTISNYAFELCDNVERLIVNSATPPTISQQSFTMSRTNCVVIVPDGSVNAYQTANYWKDFWNIISYSSITKVKTVTLNKSKVSMCPGAEITLTASISPQDAMFKNVTWSSSNASVARVSSNGVVTALSVGTAKITATATDGSGKYATCTVTVEKTDGYNDYLSHANLGYSMSQVGSYVSKALNFSLTNHGSESINIIKLVAKDSNTGDILAQSSDESVLGKLDGDDSKKLSVTINKDVNLTYEYYYEYKESVCVFDTKEVRKSKSVSLDKTSETIEVGESFKLSATVLPWSASDRSVSWKSSNPDVAKVSSSGEVTAVSKGTATITATTNDGTNKTATCKVTVTAVQVKTIELNYTSYKLTMNDILQLEATVLPENASNKEIEWSSSNEDVAMVSKSGKVVPIGIGSATITAKATDGSYVRATCRITVYKPVAESVTLNKTELSLIVGESERLTATVLPENAEDKTVTWKSSRERVATVSDEGVVTAVGVGEAVITAKCGSVSTTCKVIVSPIYVEEIILNYTTFSLQLYDVIQLEATVLPENATDKSIQWISSNDDIIYAGYSGKIIRMGDGDAVVTAKAKDGSGVTATCTFSDPNAIDLITADDFENAEIFTLDGKKVQSLRPGTFIIKTKDGKTKKIVVK